MKRRAALAAISVLPFAARAQGAMRVVGYLLEGDGHPRRLSARLAEHGYVEGRNLRFEIRRAPVSAPAEVRDKAAADLARSGAELLVASGVLNVLSLRKATSTIPIVSGGLSNPVGVGVARSLRRPGYNVTGLSFGLEESARLQIGTLRAMRPKLERIVFVAPTDDIDVAEEHKAAGNENGIQTRGAVVRSTEEAERLLAGMTESEAAWIALMPPSIDMSRVAAAAIHARIATHAASAREVEQGMLMSYWIVHSDAQGRLASVIDKVLRGGNPAEIPFELPDKTQFALNRGTAKAIGVKIGVDLLLRATEVFG